MAKGKERQPPIGEDWGDNRGEESFNKGGHRERSLANQPNHLKHKKKIKNKKN